MENSARPDITGNTFDASSMNDQLLAEYTQRVDKMYELIDANRTTEQHPSWPFFMFVSDEYITAPKRLLIIGQETYGWNNDLPRPSVDQTMNFYAQVCNQDKFHNSPFWWFRKLMAERFNISTDYAKASLWTNLSKIDVNKKRPTGKLFDNTMPFFIDLLKRELDITQPDIVLIFNTNGYYDWHINQYLSKDNSWRKELLELGVYRLYSALLPANTFQMAHPNSLRFRKGNFADKANALIDIIEKNMI